MFLRKLFNVPDKIKWLTLELLVVFVGVYLAFLFQSYSEQQKNKGEQEKVFVSLKNELDQLRMELPGFSDYQYREIERWDSLANLRQVEPFYGWRYIEPQYNFKVIEYAINIEGADIISFELYEQLLELYSEIKKVEHCERLMTEYAGRYKNIPSDIDQNGETAKVLQAENRLMFYKFRIFAGDRAATLKSVADFSLRIVESINEILGPEKTKEIDLKLLKKFLETELPIEFIEESFLKHFPQYPVELLMEEATKIRNK